MRNDLKIVMDSACEFREMLWPWVVEEFWSLDRHQFRNDVVYIIDRQRMVESRSVIQTALKETNSRFVFSLPFEGSETLVNHLLHFGIKHDVLSKRILLIGGGDMSPEYPYLSYDLFLTKFHDFQENIKAGQRIQEIFSNKSKPHTFLFFNGRERPHRKYLVERFDSMGLLDHALWSYLSPVPATNKHFNLFQDGIDLMTRTRKVKLLDRGYEIDRYTNNQVTNFDTYVKKELFDNEWGEIYVNADAYIDTYFSLVTETVCDYPYSFRTEKIVKPLGMGHPFVVAANRGYYRDLRNLGFRTFDKLIDESFDGLDSSQDRMDRIVDVVQHLCRSDLSQFLTSAEEICKYNQQHLLEVRSRIKREFPDRFFNFLDQYE